MTPEEFIAKWPGERSQMREDVAISLRVPDSSRSFLVLAGLPVDVRFNGVGFNLSGTAIRRLEAWPSLARLSKDAMATAICLDEATGGRVVQVGRKAPSRPQFLNSSVEQHAESWLAWRLIVDSTEGEDDRGVAALLRRTLREIDPSAVEDEESPWSVLIHEVELGVL